VISAAAWRPERVEVDRRLPGQRGEHGPVRGRDPQHGREHEGGERFAELARDFRLAPRGKRVEQRGGLGGDGAKVVGDGGRAEQQQTGGAQPVVLGRVGVQHQRRQRLVAVALELTARRGEPAVAQDLRNRLMIGGVIHPGVLITKERRVLPKPGQRRIGIPPRGRGERVDKAAWQLSLNHFYFPSPDGAQDIAIRASSCDNIIERAVIEYRRPAVQRAVRSAVSVCCDGQMTIR
jgi:hypothetical protein